MYCLLVCPDVNLYIQFLSFPSMHHPNLFLTGSLSSFVFSFGCTVSRYLINDGEFLFMVF